MPASVAPGGLAEVLCRTLEGYLRSPRDIVARRPGHGQAEPRRLLLLARQRMERCRSLGKTTQPALLHRIYEAIERKLADPDITPARVAQIEGISERYLQKLFESTGENFRRYLRERRLQRCWTDLASPAEAHRSVVRYRLRLRLRRRRAFQPLVSRTFRVVADRVPATGSPARPRACASGRGNGAGPRMRSRSCIAHRAAPRIRSVEPEPAGAGCTAGAKPAHHHLPVDAAHVHWGFFSRALKPLIEIGSGDTVTVETLTQHASTIRNG